MLTRSRPRHTTLHGTSAEALASASRFGKFKGESESTVREAETREPPACVMGILEVWHGFMVTKDADRDERKLLPRRLKSLAFTQEHIDAFCVLLCRYESLRGFKTLAGLFLSALVNSGGGLQYTLSLSHMNVRLDRLGNRNRKDLTVVGDVGSDAGYCMTRKGRMTVMGNAEHFAGMRMSGTLIIEGNAGGEAGHNMKTGTLTVRGNAGERTGSMMAGGKIIIEGELEGVSSTMMGGIIIHKGKTITGWEGIR